LCYTPTAPRILLELCSRPPHLPHSTFLLLMMPRPPSSTLFPYTTLFRKISATAAMAVEAMRVMIQRAARSMALRRRSREPAGSGVAAAARLEAVSSPPKPSRSDSLGTPSMDSLTVGRTEGVVARLLGELLALGGEGEL